MKTLFILRGLPGSGKTTIAHMLSSLGASVYSAEDFFIDINTGEYNFDLNKLHAHRICRNNVHAALVGGDELVVVHNTNTTVKEMKPYYELAEQYGYQVHSLIVENRHGGQNVHDVPEEALDRMERRFSIQLRS